MPFSLTHPAGTATQTEHAGSAWPATAAAADAELARLTELLAEAGVTAVPAAGVLATPGLAAGPGATVGIRVRTTSNPPPAPATDAVLRPTSRATRSACPTPRTTDPADGRPARPAP
ncbi:hypothetical protein AB0G42_23100 [Streptomyces yangpuensis]|uniref:hypothetical protein n=1 Tax=Streptomyces yangpuensis TaxID=1648182 RepID=UPI00342EBA74